MHLLNKKKKDIKQFLEEIRATKTINSTSQASKHGGNDLRSQKSARSNSINMPERIKRTDSINKEIIKQDKDFHFKREKSEFKNISQRSMAGSHHSNFDYSRPMPQPMPYMNHNQNFRHQPYRNFQRNNHLNHNQQQYQQHPLSSSYANVSFPLPFQALPFQEYDFQQNTTPISNNYWSQSEHLNQEQFQLKHYNLSPKKIKRRQSQNKGYQNMFFEKTSNQNRARLNFIDDYEDQERREKMEYQPITEDRNGSNVWFQKTAKKSPEKRLLHSSLDAKKSDWQETLKKDPHDKVKQYQIEKYEKRRSQSQSQSQSQSSSSKINPQKDNPSIQPRNNPSDQRQSFSQFSTIAMDEIKQVNLSSQKTSACKMSVNSKTIVFDSVWNNTDNYLNENTEILSIDRQSMKNDTNFEAQVHTIKKDTQPEKGNHQFGKKRLTKRSRKAYNRAQSQQQQQDMNYPQLQDSLCEMMRAYKLIIEIQKNFNLRQKRVQTKTENFISDIRRKLRRNLPTLSDQSNNQHHEMNTQLII